MVVVDHPPTGRKNIFLVPFLKISIFKKENEDRWNMSIYFFQIDLKVALILRLKVANSYKRKTQQK